MICGDGVSPCRAMLVGQNPGKQEEASAARGETGRVFIGEAGRELFEHYTALAGLTRGEDMWITNCIKCHTQNDRKPTSKEIAACSEKFLKREIEECNPEIIVMLGAVSSSLIPGCWLEAHHGFVKRVNLFGVDRWCLPMYHPAAGLHEPMKMTELIQDFERLRKILGGDRSCPTDEYPNPVYEDLTGRHDDIEAILRRGVGNPKSNPHRLMGRDTEFLQEKGSPVKIPWCSTFSIMPGTGYMIRAIDHEGLMILGRWMHYYAGILHNALADLDVEEAMGLPNCPFEDTMQLASHQGDLPQKLKALAWRLAGMTMQDYDDLVMPHSRNAVLEWLEAAYDIAVTKPGTKEIKKVKKNKRKMPKTEKALAKLAEEFPGQPLDLHDDGYLHFHDTITTTIEECDSDLTKKILHIHKHTAKPTPLDGKAYSPWEAWQEQVVGELKAEDVYEVTKRIGEMPKASIEQAFRKDERATVRYATADSDSTLRIFPVLKERSHKYEGKVMPRDIDR